MQVREFLEPVTILDDRATVADAAAMFSASRPVFLRSGGALHALLAAAVVGLPATRRLIDVPLSRADTMAADDDVAIILTGSDASAIVPVEDHGEIVGCINRGRVLEALAAAADPAAYGALLAVRAMPALLHDLANSLTVADAALPEAGSRVAVDEELAAAHVALRHASALLRRVRTLTGGGDDPPPAPVDVNAVLEELLPLLRVCAGASMEVELLLEQGLSMPLLHVRSIERVVLNLVLNARDATNGSGKVRVSTASIDAARVAVEVDDDGPGVPAGRETAIFASGATTKVGAGRGLGLAGAATVLRRFGASIELVPSALGGASFRVVLPLR